MAVYHLAIISCDADEARTRWGRGGSKKTFGGVMPRKQKGNDTSVATAESNIQFAPATSSERPAYIDGPPVNESGEIIKSDQAANESSADNEQRQWGPPYKAIFTSTAKGFEMGEDRRFKQRVFIFKEKPQPDVLAALKENGFVYRAGEKAWTIQATAANRELADRLAQQFAGVAPQATR
jgi:hypothetical protein